MNIPQHIGFILDGNRRFAAAKGRSKLYGHRQGVNNVKVITRAAFKQGVKIVTVFAFSTENWRRDSDEVEYLMKLLSTFISREVKSLARQGIKVCFFGRLNDFTPAIKKEIAAATRLTKDGQSGQLNICLSYGGRDEIVRAVKKIIKQGTPVSEVNEELISQQLDTVGLADPDLIIRTSGEQRLSGFLTWQSVYSELYFSPKFWPEFSPDDLALAIREYGRRQRRFGAN